MALTVLAVLSPSAARAKDMGKTGQNQVVSAGDRHTAVIKEDGGLWTCGETQIDVDGDGRQESLMFSTVRILDGAVSVSAGFEHTMIIKTDGSLWAWGSNLQGQLGDGTTKSKNSPIKILNGAAAVSAGSNHTMLIKTDGSLWAWGSNNFGQLGDGTTEDKYTPVKITDNVTAVSAGSGYTMLIKTDGSLWACGNNKYGQLGDGTVEDRHAPVKIIDGAVAVSTGADLYTAAIKADGSLWVWGLAYFYWKSDETPVCMPPAKILDNVVSVSVGYAHAAAVTADGGIWTWGVRDHGRLGGEHDAGYTPVKIMDGAKIPSGAAVSPPNAPAYATVSHKAAVEYLVHAGIYKGDDNGDLNLEKGLTRAELAVILARLTITKSPNLDEERIKNSFGAPFDDVPGWAIGYVTFCWQLDLVKGVSATKFDPQGTVNSKMVCTVILRWLGYAETDWSYDTAVSKAQTIGLTEDANVSGAIIKRGDTAVIIYRALDGRYTKTPSPTTPEPTSTPDPTPTPSPIIKDGGVDVAGVKIGDSVSIAEKALGSPYRTVTGDLQYRFYGGYSSFAMLGIRGETVEYVYANYSIPAAGGGHRLYKDDRGGERIYAVAAGKAGQETPTVTEAIIFETANAFRAFHDLSALTWNDKLGAAARTHSEDMAARGYFSHFTPEGKSPADRMTAAGYRWLDWGENITVSYITGVEAVDNWVHSTSGHREQILTKSHTETGVGCADVSKSEWETYATQKFGYPSV
jgi:hypothetical protein